MKKKGWFVHGTEISSMSALEAKEKVGDDAILVNKDLDEIKNIDINFDIITLWHVLEHLNEPKKIVNLIEEKLINKGYVVVEVPNFNSFQHLIYLNGTPNLVPKYNLQFHYESNCEAGE